MRPLQGITSRPKKKPIPFDKPLMSGRDRGAPGAAVGKSRLGAADAEGCAALRPCGLAFVPRPIFASSTR